MKRASLNVQVRSSNCESAWNTGSVAMTADNLADELAAVTGAADDLLDGDALLGQGENDAVGLLLAQIEP